MSYTNADRFIQDSVAALKSGDYPQTLGKLRRPDRSYASAGYCCLGVMCETYDPNHWHMVDSLYYEYREPDTDQKMDNGLPDSILELLGLNGRDHRELPIPVHIVQRHAPEYVRPDNLLVRGTTIYITTLNDEGCPFPVIADIISDWWKERKETA